MAKTLFFLGTLIFGAVYTVEAVRVGLGNLTHPGPGFLPVLVGFAAVVLSAVLLVSEVREKKPRMTMALQLDRNILKTVYASIGLAAYVLLLRPIHYPATTFALSVFLMWIAGFKRPVAVGIYSCLITLGLYLTFSHLQVPLP